MQADLHLKKKINKKKIVQLRIDSSKIFPPNPCMQGKSHHHHHHHVSFLFFFFFCFDQHPPHWCDCLCAGETWEEKISKGFYNTDMAVLSGTYLFGIRGTSLFLSDSSVIGVKERLSTVQHLYNFIMNGEKTGKSHRKPVMADQVRTERTLSASECACMGWFQRGY